MSAMFHLLVGYTVAKLGWSVIETLLFLMGMAFGNLVWQALKEGRK